MNQHLKPPKTENFWFSVYWYKAFILILTASQVLEITQYIPSIPQESSLSNIIHICVLHKRTVVTEAFCHMSLLASNNRIQKAIQDTTTELLHIPFPQLLAGSTFYKRKWWNIRTFASSVWPQLLTLLSSSGSTISWCCSGSWLWAWTCWIASGASPKWWVSPAIPRAGVWRRVGWVPRVWKGGCRSVAAEQIS